ncbi:hypothetical protein U9M48_026922, partial [Paspalum notatum var. saurae]
MLSVGVERTLVPRLSALARSELGMLLDVLGAVSLTDAPDERRSPFLDKDGKLRTGPLYRALCEAQRSPSPSAKFVWGSGAPPRVQFFTWLVLKGRLQCRENLAKKHIVDDGCCEFCPGVSESMAHILLECPFAVEFWRRIGCFSVLPGNVAEMHTMACPPHVPTARFSAFLQLCCWHLWKRRNEAIFREELKTLSCVLAGCKEDARLWAYRFKIEEQGLGEEWCAVGAFSAPSVDSQKKNHCWPGSRWLIDVSVGSGCGVVVSAAIVTLSLSWQRRHRRRRLCGKVAAVAPLVAAARNTVDSLTVYTYTELGAATAGFAEERRVGGTAVYRAVISGQAFAVKRVSGDVRGEVGVLSRVNHSCLIRLAGICAHRGDTYLVLEFAENGALGGLLHGGGGVLNWKQRVQVASDVTSGLDYLHHFTNPPYVHKNLNSGNVLLDAKLSSLGLARAMAAGTGGVGVQATAAHRGHAGVPGARHGLMSTQMDVFAFGVILLELLSGKEPVFVAADGHSTSLLWEEAAEGMMIDGGDDEAWFRLKEFMDPRLQGHYPFGLASTMAALALRCVAREPRARPSMGE